MTCPACGGDVLDIDVKCGHCGAVLGASGAHRLIGTVMLGQYELVDVLGQGGMSVVFKGRHKLTNQDVALKILPPELAVHSQVKSRFLEEAKALAALDHPNIVHLYNFGQDEGNFVLAMQFVEGQTWERRILEAQRLDWATSCRIAIDVLRALEYAHGRGIVHRDMKPSNVLVRARDGVATVMDFGIAKMTTSTRLTETGQTMGTVRYMSPEQVRGQAVDLRTDIYSLGATLYESLLGDTPFGGDTHFEIMTKHLSELPRRPSKLGVAMPDAVEDAVMRCLAKRPDDRFAGARELRRQLEAALRDQGVGLVETQRLDRDEIAGPRGPAAPAIAPTGGERSRAGGGGARATMASVNPRGGTIAQAMPQGPAMPPVNPRGATVARGSLAGEAAGDADEDRSRLEDPAGAARGREDAAGGRQPRRRLLPWLALALAVLIGGGAAATVAMRRAAGYRSTVEIAGVALTRGITAGKLLVETDGAVAPDELARQYARTLGELRRFVEKAGRAGEPGIEIADPIDVLLAVPAAALCEPTAYLDRQPPRDCASVRWAIAIGPGGTHRLMVVSDRAQLGSALRHGVVQAVCLLSPVDDSQARDLCDLVRPFAESAN